MCVRLCLLTAWLVGATGMTDNREAAARAVLAAAKITTFTVAETNDLRVFATLSQSRTTTIAKTAQKAHAAALAALNKEESGYWGSKLTVYAVTDGRQTRSMLLFGLKAAGGRETIRVDPFAEVPNVLAGVATGENRTDNRLIADISTLVATAVLAKEAGEGTDLPAWLRVGFGRVMQVRAEGTKAQSAQQAKYRVLSSKTNGKLSPADVWAGTDEPDAEVRAMAFVEFLISGPPASKFSQFVAGFKPTTMNPQPTVNTALEAAGWKVDWLTEEFRRWLANRR